MFDAPVSVTVAAVAGVAIDLLILLLQMESSIEVKHKCDQMSQHFLYIYF